MAAAAWAHGLRLGARLAAAHHPVCSWFRTDLRRLASLDVCAGCAFALPAFAAACGIAAAALVGGAAPLPLLAVGVVLGWPHLATYVRRGSRGERAAAKLLGGAGLGLVLVAGAALPMAAPVKLAAAASLGAAFLGLQGVRLRRILATCRACPWAARWDACPGFAAPARARAPAPPTRF